jgi:hypothetical protein
MDLSKYPVEKLFYFVAGIIPGFVALLIFHVAIPGSFGWFFALGFLGYKTKLGLIIMAAFVIGNSMTTFLNAFLGAIGGIIGTVLGWRPYKPSHSFDVAPWRDPRWRTLLKNHLGAQAPNDSHLMSQELFNLRRTMVEQLPTQDRFSALASLNLEKINTEKDDSEWANWYDHYHQIVLQPDSRDFVWHVRNGLNFNLQVSSLYVLMSATIVPGVRHWWCILPACLWLLMLVAEGFWEWKRFTDRWLTLSEQIKHLEGLVEHNH